MGEVDVLAYRTPFETTHLSPCRFEAGLTLSQMLGEHARRSILVRVGGQPVPEPAWHLVRPKAGVRVEVTMMPEGGGGASKWIRLAAVVAIAYVTGGLAAGAAWSFTAGMSTAAAGAWAAAFSVTAMLALNALVPPPMPHAGGGGGDPFDQLNSLTGTSNQANPHGVIPCVVGSTRMFPPHAALPFTEVLGDDQYLRMMLDCGPGDLDISDITIGDTALAEYDGVEWEFTTQPTLFTQDVDEVQVGYPLEATGDTTTRTSQTDSDELSLDIWFNQGLFGMNKKGKTTRATVFFTVEYRATGTTGAWLSAGSAPGLSLAGGMAVSGTRVSVSNAARKTVRSGIRWTVPSGQYDIRVRRTGESFDDAEDNSKISAATWTVVRSISARAPSTTGTNKLCLRIKASDQLNGTVSNLSCLLAQRIRRWDGDSQAWLEPVVSTNPAWIYLWLLTQCPAVKKRLDDARVDYATAVAHWAGFCDDHGLSTSFTIDSARPLSSILQDVLTAGMATRSMVNGRYSVTLDEPQAYSVQLFSEANSTNFQMSRDFTPPPHALNCTFINPAADYQEDQVLVYADGYSADGSNGTQAAALISDLDMRQVQDAGAVWHVGRFHLASMWYRPVIYQWDTGIDNLKCSRGSMVKLATPIISMGVSTGRLRAVDGINLTLSEPVELESGKSYVLEWRNPQGGTTTVNVTSAAGQTRNLTIDAAIPDAAPDDLYVIGEKSSVTIPVLVTKIRRTSGLNATLTAVDVDPRVWAADAGDPPEWVSQITGKPWCEPPALPVVHIRTGTSAPDNAGVVRVQAGVGSSGSGAGVVRFPVSHCPQVDELVLMSDGTSKRAGDIVVGDQVVCADPVTLAQGIASVQASEPGSAACVEVNAGARCMVCSWDAPVPTRRGGLRKAANVAGQEVGTLEGWCTVRVLRSRGKQAVQHIDIGGGCFYVSGILHHNKRLSSVPSSNVRSTVTVAQ